MLQNRRLTDLPIIGGCLCKTDIALGKEMQEERREGEVRERNWSQHVGAAPSSKELLLPCKPPSLRLPLSLCLFLAQLWLGSAVAPRHVVSCILSRGFFLFVS